MATGSDFNSRSLATSLRVTSPARSAASSSLTSRFADWPTRNLLRMTSRVIGCANSQISCSRAAPAAVSSLACKYGRSTASHRRVDATRSLIDSSRSRQRGAGANNYYPAARNIRMQLETRGPLWPRCVEWSTILAHQERRKVFSGRSGNVLFLSAWHFVDQEGCHIRSWNFDGRLIRDTLSKSRWS